MKFLEIGVLLVGLTLQVDANKFWGKVCRSETESGHGVFSGDDEKSTPAKKNRGTFTIGKKTTFVSGPVDADGHIDYVAALNERLGKGVTVENNSAALLWKVLGPQPEKESMPAKFSELLGVKLPKDGDYYVSLKTYLEKQEMGDPDSSSAINYKLGVLHWQTWTAKKHPEINGWLKANEKPLSLLAEAMKRSHYYSPLIPPRNEKGSTGLVNTRLPSLQLSRELAKILIVQAMLYLGEGDTDAAWKNLMTCHRLGRMVGRGGTLIENLVGIAIEATAITGEVVFLDKSKVDAKRLAACLEDLHGLPPRDNPAEKIDLCERFVFLDRIMLIDKNGLEFLTGPEGKTNTPNPFGEFALDGINWDPALETANLWFDRMANAMREKDRDKRVLSLETFTKDFTELRLKAANKSRLAEMLKAGKGVAKSKGEVIGDILITQMFPAVKQTQDGADKITQSFDNLLIAFALARYQHANGKYPEKLEALTPKFLAIIPKDIFSGKALKYKSTGTGYLLYSVGLNGEDDGGRAFYDQPPGDDLSIRMPNHGPDLSPK
jgi:hypothetical protein